MSTTTVPTTGAGLEGVVAGESEICYIDGYAGVLSYRGYNIHTLAEHATFEEVIWLLWKGTLPKADELAQLKADLFAQCRRFPQQVDEFLKANAKAVPMDVLRTAVSMLSLSDPQAKDMSPGGESAEGDEADGADFHHRQHFRPVRGRASRARAGFSLSFAANFLYCLTGKKPERSWSTCSTWR